MGNPADNKTINQTAPYGAFPIVKLHGAPAAAMSTWDAPMSGAFIVGTGVASHAKIPVPGTQGLVLSLRPPPNWRGGSTSTLFIQNPADLKFGKPYLRLDYGYNKSTKVIDYHWNIEGKAARQAFPNITNHMPAGPQGEILYNAAKAFKVAGRVFVVFGAVMDGVSILTADRPWRRAFQVVSAWAAAGALSVQLGRAGAAAGTFFEPGGGTAIGGLVGAVAGGFIGYFSAEATAGYVYDWAENTHFIPAEEVPVPAP